MIKKIKKIRFGMFRKYLHNFIATCPTEECANFVVYVMNAYGIRKDYKTINEIFMSKIRESKKQKKARENEIIT